MLGHIPNLNQNHDQGEDMPRDPQRINPTLNIIRNIWYKFPELRLGQLLTNITPAGKDLFYLEDDELIERLKEYEKSARWMP